MLFIDEIHRFNKAQQDAFLPYVERGDIVLIGATTENPSFEVNRGAALPRQGLHALRALDRRGADAAAPRPERREARPGRASAVEISDDLLRQIAVFSNGDARAAYNTLETAVAAAPRDAEGTRHRITEALIEDAIQRKMLLYDKAGEEHYNLISALHKSVRNSDPGRRALLAGTHAGGGRRSALHRAPPDSHGLGRHRHGRPPCPRRDRGGDAGGAFSGNAGREPGAGGGGGLPRARAQVQRALRRLWRSRARRAEDHGGACPACICATP